MQIDIQEKRTLRLILNGCGQVRPSMGKISKRCPEIDGFSGVEKVDWKIENFLTSLEGVDKVAPECPNFGNIRRGATRLPCGFNGVDNSLEDRFEHFKLVRMILDVFSIFIFDR